MASSSQSSEICDGEVNNDPREGGASSFDCQDNKQSNQDEISNDTSMESNELTQGEDTMNKEVSLVSSKTI